MEPPWVGLGAAVWAEIAAGSACTFPLYSLSLKSVLGFNQKQLTFLGVANDIGENVCNKFPPRAVLLVGAFPSFLGSGVLYLSVSQTVQSRPYWLSKMVPRTFWMTVTQIIMILTFLLYASALSGTLYAATALLGICYGAQFRIMIPTTSELFGLRRFGLTFNFMQLGNPAVAFLFSRWLAGHVYDTEAAKQQVSSCMGPNCFRFTFLVLAGVCGLGTFLSIILTIRIRPNALCWRFLPSAQKL